MKWTHLCYSKHNNLKVTFHNSKLVSRRIPWELGAVLLRLFAIPFLSISACARNLPEGIRPRAVELRSVWGDGQKISSALTKHMFIKTRSCPLWFLWAVLDLRLFYAIWRVYVHLSYRSFTDHTHRANLRSRPIDAVWLVCVVWWMYFCFKRELGVFKGQLERRSYSAAFFFFKQTHTFTFLPAPEASSWDICLSHYPACDTQHAQKPAEPSHLSLKTHLNADAFEIRNTSVIIMKSPVV